MKPTYQPETLIPLVKEMLLIDILEEYKYPNNPKHVALVVHIWFIHESALYNI